MEELLVELLKANRNQRHDFLNHLQVIWGYLKLKRNDKAVDYMQDVVSNLQSLRCLNNITSPELAADISAKVLEMGMQENFTINVPKLFDISQSNVAKVRIIVNQVWKVIKDLILVDNMKVELSFIDNKMVVTVHNGTEETIYIDKVKNIAKETGFACQVEGRQITINLVEEA